LSALSPFFAFPVAVWTVLVAISLVYWLFVMSGLVHLGEGVDGGADGAAEGASGAIKGALEGAAGGHHVDVGGGDVDMDVDAGGDAGGHEGAGAEGHGEAGSAHGFMGLFRMRNVPITVSFTLVAFFSWVLSFVALWGAGRLDYAPNLVVKCLVTFLAAPIFALPLAKLVTAPLAPLLTPRQAKRSRDLIGKTCTIRTGEANAGFGEALVKDTGADLVLRVRVDVGAMKRGDEGLIVAFDEEREEYVVEPMDDALGRRKDA
jgi:hypothetical protein